MKQRIVLFMLLLLVTCTGVFSFNYLKRSDQRIPKSEPLQTIVLPGKTNIAKNEENNSPSPDIKAILKKFIADKNVKEPIQHDYEPPEVKDSRLTSLVDRRRPLKERIPGDIVAKIPNIKGEKDKIILIKVLQDVNDDDAVRNEILNLLTRSKDPGLPKTLISILENKKEGPRFRAFAIQHLGMLLLNPDYHPIIKQNPDDISEKLGKLMLNDKDLSVRKEALFALAKINDPLAVDFAVKLLQEKSPNAYAMKHLCIRIVKDLDLKQHIPILRPCLLSKNKSTRIAAIVALSQWGDTGSRKLIAEAANSPDLRVRNAGKAALIRMPPQ